MATIDPDFVDIDQMERKLHIPRYLIHKALCTSVQINQDWRKILADATTFDELMEVFRDTEHLSSAETAAIQKLARFFLKQPAKV